LDPLDHPHADGDCSGDGLHHLHHHPRGQDAGVPAKFASVIIPIILLDVVFSLGSVITAVVIAMG
jgi:predicted tellurium resistance membrane protein TerC